MVRGTSRRKRQEELTLVLTRQDRSGASTTPPRHPQHDRPRRDHELSEHDSPVLPTDHAPPGVITARRYDAHERATDSGTNRAIGCRFGLFPPPVVPGASVSSDRGARPPLRPPFRLFSAAVVPSAVLFIGAPRSLLPAPSPLSARAVHRPRPPRVRLYPPLPVPRPLAFVGARSGLSRTLSRSSAPGAPCPASLAFVCARSGLSRALSRSSALAAPRPPTAGSSCSSVQPSAPPRNIYFLTGDGNQRLGGHLYPAPRRPHHGSTPSPPRRSAPLPGAPREPAPSRRLRGAPVARCGVDLRMRRRPRPIRGRGRRSGSLRAVPRRRVDVARGREPRAPPLRRRSQPRLPALPPGGGPEGDVAGGPGRGVRPALAARRGARREAAARGRRARARGGSGHRGAARGHRGRGDQTRGHRGGAGVDPRASVGGPPQDAQEARRGGAPER